MSTSSTRDVSKDVTKIQKKLEKIVAKPETHADAKDLLSALRDIPITLDVLTKTRIGMTVNNLRKSISDEEVISIAKGLIKHWKKLLDKNDKDSNGNGANPGSKSNDSVQKKPIKQESKPLPKHSVPANTSDDVRLKCREMISNALKVELPAESSDLNEIFHDPEDLAAKIEDAIFREFKNTDMKYKNRVRSRVANLKDVKNPDLRCNVLRGAITPDKVAVMTAEEMASKEMKDLRQKFTKESIDDHQMTVQGGTKTDLLKCPQCKKTNCTYNQVQTRSADEPMTTFCFCNECGKRWKFC